MYKPLGELDHAARVRKAVSGVGAVPGVHLLTRGVLLTLGLSKLVEIHLEGLDVVLESQGRHRPQKVLPVDRFPLFSLALVAGLARDETYELGNALLHRLFRILCNFGVRRKCLYLFF